LTRTGLPGDRYGSFFPVEAVGKHVAWPDCRSSIATPAEALSGPRWPLEKGLERAGAASDVQCTEARPQPASIAGVRAGHSHGTDRAKVPFWPSVTGQIPLCGLFGFTVSVALASAERTEIWPTGAGSDPSGGRRG
jgi:hypothetical protein